MTLRRSLIIALCAAAGLFYICDTARAQNPDPARQRLFEKYQEVEKAYEAAARVMDAAQHTKELADFHAVDLQMAAAKAQAAGSADADSLAKAAAQAKAGAEADGAALAEAQAEFAAQKQALMAVNAESNQFNAEHPQRANSQPAKPPAPEVASEKTELQDEVADAARSLAMAKTVAAAKTAELAKAQAAAVAAPENVPLQQAVTTAETDAKAAEQAVVDAKAAMDAKLAALLKVAPKLDAAEQAAENAKKAAEEARKLAAEKAAAAARAKAVAKNAERAKEDEAAFAVDARVWLANTAALAKKAHWIAVVDVSPEGKPGTGFRYDHFPGVERVTEGDGTSYVRPAGKDWMVSKDWGKTGELVTKDRNAPPDNAVMILQDLQAAKLDAMAGMAQWVFQPDPPQGRVAWKVSAEGVQRDTGRPPPGGISPPVMVFYDDKHPMYGKDKSGSLMRELKEQWIWDGQTADVGAEYFFVPDETAPPAGLMPEEQLGQALAATQAKPVKVDAVVNGALRYQYQPGEKARVSGIVSGKDFDLTVIKGGAVTRQIAVGDDAWSSGDGGATWQKLAAADRSYFNLLMVAFNHDFAMSYPVEVADPAVRVGDAAVANGETWRRYEPRERYNINYTPDEYWVAMKDGKPSELRRYEALRGPWYLYVDFSDVATGQGVVPPPGNAEAVPAQRPEELLAEAIYAMETAGMWKTEWRVDVQEKAGQKDGQDAWKVTKCVQQIHGLVSGKDFDLTSSVPGQRLMFRFIGVKDKVWQNSNVYPKWQEAVNNGGFFGQAELGSVEPDMRRAYYDHVFHLFQKEFVDELYEAVGTETHDGETWLHIRMIGRPERVRGRPEYWIQLDAAGKAVAVRHYVLVTANGGPDRPFRTGEGRESEEGGFEPAGANEKIEAPAGVEVTKNQ